MKIIIINVAFVIMYEYLMKLHTRVWHLSHKTYHRLAFIISICADVNKPKLSHDTDRDYQTSRIVLRKQYCYTLESSIDKKLNSKLQ